MDVQQLVEGGLRSTQNVYITIGIVFILVTLSYFTKILDIPGVISAAALGLIVGALGHWSWLVILLIFLTNCHVWSLAMSCVEPRDGDWRSAQVRHTWVT